MSSANHDDHHNYYHHHDTDEDASFLSYHDDHHHHYHDIYEDASSSSSLSLSSSSWSKGTTKRNMIQIADRVLADAQHYLNGLKSMINKNISDVEVVRMLQFLIRACQTSHNHAMGCLKSGGGYSTLLFDLCGKIVPLVDEAKELLLRNGHNPPTKCL